MGWNRLTANNKVFDGVAPTVAAALDCTVDTGAAATGVPVADISFIAFRVVNAGANTETVTIIQVGTDGVSKAQSLVLATTAEGYIRVLSSATGTVSWYATAAATIEVYVEGYVDGLDGEYSRTIYTHTSTAEGGLIENDSPVCQDDVPANLTNKLVIMQAQMANDFVTTKLNEIGLRTRDVDDEVTSYDLPMDYVVDVAGLDAGGALTGTYGTPDFLWIDGDGNTPSIGTALSATGAPTTGQSTPWELSGGADVTAEEYDGSAYRSTATANDPASGEDIVVFWIGRLGAQGAGANVEIATRNAAAGFQLYRASSGSLSLYVRDVAGATASPATLAIESGWIVIIGIVDLDGNTHLYTNNIAAAPVASPAGNIYPGGGVSLGSRFGALIVPDGTKCAATGIYYGAGIADTWLASSAALVKRFTSDFCGTTPDTGTIGAYSRASMASWLDHDDIWEIATSGLPRGGDSDGLRVEPARTNLVYNNINNSITTGWTATGGTFTYGDDAVALTAGGFQAFGPGALVIINATGSTQYVYGGATTGSTSAHSLSVISRQFSGAGAAYIGLWDVSASTYSNAVTLGPGSSYARTIARDQTPPDTDSQFCVKIEDDCVVYFVAAQLELGDVATSPIPNWATAATATRAADVLTTDETPVNLEGSVTLTVTPDGWGGTDAGTVEILQHTGAGSPTLHVTTGTWQCDIDGTTTLDSGVAPVDGTPATIRLQWAAGGRMSINVGGTVVSGDYDGTLQAAGAWEIVADDAPILVSDFEATDNNGRAITDDDSTHFLGTGHATSDATANFGSLSTCSSALAKTGTESLLIGIT